MGREPCIHYPQDCGRAAFGESTRVAAAGAPARESVLRPSRCRRAYTSEHAMESDQLRLGRQTPPPCNRVAEHLHRQAHPQTHRQGLQRLGPRRTPRAVRLGIQCEHKNIQCPAAHHHRMARRQARRRRYLPSRTRQPLSQACDCVLPAPRRRCDFDGRHPAAPCEPEARCACGLRDFWQHRRGRRGYDALHNAYGRRCRPLRHRHSRLAENEQGYPRVRRSEERR